MNKKIINNIVKKKNNEKIIFTAGPSSLSSENIIGLAPCFGRGDKLYLDIENYVLNKLKAMSGHKHIARFQGSGSLAIEMMITNFLYGKVLIIDTGYYSERLLKISKDSKKTFKNIKKIDYINYLNLENVTAKYDWVLGCYTETSVGLKLSINQINKICKKTKSKLMLDATASFGLENNHELADVISFSSCKGLFGLTGASFICFNKFPENNIQSFYLNLQNHLDKKMTGPYHSILSLYHVLKNHDSFRESVKINKNIFLKKMKEHLTVHESMQPLLCTYVDVKIKTKNKKVILYQPRNNLSGSVVCHIGEVHLGNKAKGDILKYLSYV